MITKKDMDLIHQKHIEAKRDFKNRALMVIEALCSDDVVWKDKNRADIYEIAHVAIGTCLNEHTSWVEKTEKLFKAFEKDGIL